MTMDYVIAENGRCVWIAKDETEIAAYAARLNLADDEPEIVGLMATGGLG